MSWGFAVAARAPVTVIAGLDSPTAVDSVSVAGSITVAGAAAEGAEVTVVYSLDSVPVLAGRATTGGDGWLLLEVPLLEE